MSPEARKDSGFTLIELLVVIIIIGILAAIAIPVFLNQRQKAVDDSLKSDLHIVVTYLEDYFVDDQVYPVAAGVSATAIFPGIRLSQGNTVTVTVDNTTDDYCLVAAAVGAKATQDWVYVHSLGGLQAMGVTTC